MSNLSSSTKVQTNFQTTNLSFLLFRFVDKFKNNILFKSTPKKSANIFFQIFFIQILGWTLLEVLVTSTKREMNFLVFLFCEEFYTFFGFFP